MATGVQTFDIGMTIVFFFTMDQIGDTVPIDKYVSYVMLHIYIYEFILKKKTLSLERACFLCVVC